MSEENQNPKDELHYVRTGEAEIKPPPRLETGILKWVRDNLFSSTMNTILTIVGLAIVIYSILGVGLWAIQEANWYAVTYNLRFYLLGRFNPEYEWRIKLIWLFSIFVMGAGIAVWVKQIARTMLVAMFAVVLATLLIPALVVQVLDVPSAYMVASNVPVSEGTATALPLETIGFIGQEGETIEIRYADALASEDARLAEMAGFLDPAANLLRNGAANRLAGIERQAWLEETIATNAASDVPLLTANQLEIYRAELEAYSEVAPITESYHLNQNLVRITILDADTLAPISPPSDVRADETLSIEIPATGWYLFQREYLAGEIAEGVTLLDVKGLSPILQSSSYSSEAGGFVDSFLRLTDGLRIQDPRPQLDGDDIPILIITENQYRGTRSVSDYLRAYLAPFLQLIGYDLLWILLLGVIGYWTTIFIRNNNGQSAASSFAGILLASLPIMFWILVNGLYLLSAITWMLVIALGLLSYLSYQIGRRYGNTPITYLIPVAIYIVFVIVLLLTNGFDLPRYLKVYTLLIDPAGVPRFILWLGILPLLMGAYLGTGLHIIGDDLRVNWMLYGIVGAGLFILATALLLSGMIDINTTWLLQPSSSNNWGGLLLAMAITIYGIIIAFPIGIGLALGRRSDLPLIKGLCIAYIELVRGSPFITVLFFMQLLLPLLNSELAQVTNTYRAIIATIAFSAAYLAENVRGGLQSLPSGQSEAAKALGLSGFQMTILITLPQALRAVIPALVGQFISLFKDTSLVSIVGLTDLVRAVDTVNSQAEFSSTRLEGLLFISIIYFVFSYVMSYVSRVLEASGSGITRRM